jgi:hypothetical protein
VPIRSHAKRTAGNKPDLGRAFANQRTPPTQMSVARGQCADFNPNTTRADRVK